jgi:hypothetical protein
MFIKNILRAFDRDTKIEVYWADNGTYDGIYDPHYTTVGQFMDSGLLTYMEVDEEQPFYVRDSKIIIWIKNVN